MQCSRPLTCFGPLSAKPYVQISHMLTQAAPTCPHLCRGIKSRVTIGQKGPKYPLYYSLGLIYQDHVQNEYHGQKQNSRRAVCSVFDQSIQSICIQLIFLNSFEWQQVYKSLHIIFRFAQAVLHLS